MKNVIFIFLFIPITIFAQDWHEEQRTYKYDNLNRLVKVFFNSGTVYEYQYDNLGNRLERLVYEAPKTYVPDDAFEQYLIDEGYDTVLDDYVYTHKIDDIESLSMSDLGIADLTGIEDFEALKILWLNNNQLTTIDITQNTLLEELHASINFLETIDTSLSPQLIHLGINSNNLTQIDISENPILEVLAFSDNNITTLNVSNTPILERLFASNNALINLDLSATPELTFVNISNNNLESLNVENNNNIILVDFKAENNPNLFCIQVDDDDDANNGIGVYANWDTDAQVQFSYDCNLTYVPDDAFEQRLIDLGYDIVLNNYVVTADIDNVTSLSATNLDIQDATGIEDFTSIEVLYFNFNNIESIDLSQNTQLRVFHIGENNLTSIDITNNTLLVSLNVSNNNLTGLDITNNPNIDFLTCKYNQITSLDLTNNSDLEFLNAHYNAITNLDVSQNSNLSYIWIRNNPIETLDFSNNPNLDELNARNCEQLTTLNLKNGNNNILTTVLTQNSPNLYCIQVDDENAANNNSGIYANWNNDNQVEFSEDCAALGLNEFGLPPDNYNITTVGLSCINSGDGVINITTEKQRDYTVQIVSDVNGINDSFPMNTGNDWEIYEDYFEGGEYFIYITLAGVDENLYKKTFILNLQEPEPLEAVSNRSAVSGRYVVEMTKGTAPFTIKINSEIIGVTNESEYSFDVNHGDVVEVSTSKACEGKFTETINILDDFTLYPNPTNDIVYFSIPLAENIEKLNIQLFDMNGSMVEAFNKSVINSKIELSIKHLSNGIYLVKFPTLGEKTFKIIKE